MIFIEKETWISDSATKLRFLRTCHRVFPLFVSALPTLNSLTRSRPCDKALCRQPHAVPALLCQPQSRRPRSLIKQHRTCSKQDRTQLKVSPTLFLLSSCLTLRHRIVTATTARATAQDAPYGKPQPLEGTIFADSLNGILGTCRCKPAAGRRKGRDGYSIKADGKDKYPSEDMQNCVEYRLHILSDIVCRSLPTAARTQAES